MTNNVIVGLCEAMNKTSTVPCFTFHTLDNLILKLETLLVYIITTKSPLYLHEIVEL